MEKKTLLLIGIPTVGTLAVANLLYFWLAPEVACKMLVYCFCCGVIFLQAVASAILWHFFGPQKVMPMVVSGSAFGLAILAAGGLMLSLDAPFKTALYFLIILCVLYLICIGYLSCIAADELWNRSENAIITLPSPRNCVQDMFVSLRAAFSRRRPGETMAERYVRNRRQAHPAPNQSSSAPPPLPNQHR